MNLALNEVEACAKKAARGAGYSWGMSEEAAKATRWLCANGIDGIKALATVLNVADSSEPDQMSPEKISDNWQSSSGVMCPLMAGATLSDFAGVGPAITVTISNLVSPVLLLPFASLAARQLGTVVKVEWNGVAATTDGAGLGLDGSMDSLTTDRTPQVTIQRTDQIGRTFAQHSRATPSDADWATLNMFAHRTYAPATEESRILGAGAGLSDND